MMHHLPKGHTLKRSLLVALAALALSPAAASAMPPATITTTQTAPLSFTFKSSPCMFGFCGYSWRGYSATSNRLGFTIGYTDPVSYTFPAAGSYTVTVRVGGRCTATGSAQCPADGSTSVVAG